MRLSHSRKPAALSQISQRGSFSLFIAGEYRRAPDPRG
jgi:hypothetical protein